MTKRAHLRSLAIGLLALGLPVSVIAATFQGPATQPPTGNAPGVIWNMKDNPSQTQSGAVINIPGLRNDPATKDVYLENSKAFRVDGNTSTTFNFGNWGGSSGQKPFTANFWGDVLVNDFGASSGQRGRVQATEFCFNPGNPSDCIQDWGSAGGSGFVLKTGDTMTGNLQVLKNYSGNVGSTSTLNISSSGLFGSTFTEINGANIVLSPPNSANAVAAMNGVKSLINQSGGSTSLSSSNAVYGNNANSGATNDYAYGGNFLASVNNSGRINQEVAGVHGQFNATTDFNTINRALGVYGEALNTSPTKSPSYLYGVQGYAQGKSLVESAGVLGIDFVNTARTTPQMGVFGVTTLSGGGTATNAYGVRGWVSPSGGSATNAYGVYGSTVGVTATNEYGVYGTSDGTGVYGNGSTGVYGNGVTYGGFFTGQMYGVYGVPTAAAGGAGVRGVAGPSNIGVYGSAPVGKTAVLAESETLSQGTPLVSRYGAIGADISGQSFGLKVRSAGSIGIDIDAVTGLRASSTNQAALFDNNTNGVYSRAQATGIDGRTYGGSSIWSGVYGESETAAGNGGRFNNPLASTEVYLATNGYSINALGPVNVKNSSNAQMFYINNTGEVHSNGSPYAGYYFHDRQNLANVLWAWYSDGGATPANSTARLYRSGVGDLMTVDSVGNLTIGSGTTGCLKDRDGTIISGTCSSDERLKTNIKNWNSDALSALMNLPIKTYDWKQGGKDQLGVIAQDAQKADKNLVQLGPDGLLQVHFEELPFYTIKAVQQLKTENDQLKSKVDSLEQRLQKLEAKLK